jgi:hypothetical protein
VRKLLPVILTAAALAAPAATASGPASLKVVRLAPFTVKGAGFEPNEGVILSAYVRRRLVRRVRADGSGRFRVVFRGARPAGCSGYAVTAIGNRGSRASITFMPRCPPRPRVVER